MVKIFTVYHSGFGHTKRQAEAVHAGVAGVEGVDATLLTAAEATERLDDLDDAEAILFGCPTYMGSISAEMKKFLEAAAKKWFELKWKDKVSGVFTNSSSYSGDKVHTLVGLIINAMQHGMIHVGTAMLPAASDPDSMNTLEGPGPDVHNRVGSFVGAMATSGQVDAPKAPPSGDIETARLYGERVATVTKQLVRGRQG